MKLAQVFGFGTVTLLVASASASIIPSFINTLTSAGVTTFDYDVNLDNQQNLITGSELCLADVVGLTGTPTAPANWTAVNQPSSACPTPPGAGVILPNNPASVLYMYTGSTTIFGAPNGVDLGTFTLQSLYSATALDVAYGGLAQKNSNSTLTSNQGQVVGPSAVPEPTTTAMVGIALALMALARRRLDQKKV